MRRRECIEQNLAGVVRFDDRRYIIRGKIYNIPYRKIEIEERNILIAASHDVTRSKILDFLTFFRRIRACLLLNDTAKRA